MGAYMAGEGRETLDNTLPGVECFLFLADTDQDKMSH